MDRSSVINLLQETYEVDEIGQRVPVITPRTVFCNISSVTGTEWFSAGQNGIRPEYRITMFRYDYHGEEAVNIGGELVNGVVEGGKNYSVYRTYIRDNDELELYVEKKAGT